MSTISVIIITKNAASTLRACLESVAWATEIIVVDSGSSDDTLKISREFTDKVIEHSWLGFGPQKNYALQQAKHEWVLSIDADEWLDSKLITEIQHAIQAPESAIYSLPRCSKFCGQFIKHGAWGNDRVTRLFKRNSARFSNDQVHEKLVYQGNVKKLQHWLWHDSCDNLTTAITKMNDYSSLSAQMKLAQGKHGSLASALFRGFWTFLKAYIFKAGFLDGKAGFILSWVTAQGSYYRYLKLLYLQEAPNDSKNY